MKAIICGGRDYRDGQRFMSEMNRLHRERPITEVIEGGALGADLFAKKWAQQRSIPVHSFEADWKAHGKSAGFIRNLTMIQQRPDIVIAFPGGKGTVNMAQQAVSNGIELVRIDW